MSWPEDVTLRGRHASLEPLAPEHAEGLAQASADGEVWRLWYTRVPKPEEVPAEIERRLQLKASGMMHPFAVRDASGRLVGMTTYCNMDAVSPRVEIGYTWYAKSVQRTALNTECKLMLLRHAFETLRCANVSFETSWFNHASRAAIARLGARQDGVLRNAARHRDGSLRDTVVFSILDSEWPAVRTHLQFRLESHP